MPLSYNEIRQYSDRKIFTALTAIMMVALVATGIFLFCLNNVLRLRQESIQITKVQTLLDAFYIELLNAETGQRGFLLTGDETYLQPYETAIRQLPGKGAQLEILSGKYAYASKVKEVRAVAGERINILKTGIATRLREGPEAALMMVQDGQGQQHMNRLRDLLGDISRQQTTELNGKRLLASNYGDWAQWISVIMAIGVITLAGLVYYLFISAIKSERALDRAKDEFVSLASHQLRTPAAGLKSILSMMKAGDFGPLNQLQDRMVGRAIDSNEREIRIVDELLNVARADAGRLVLKPIKLDITKLIKSVASEQCSGIEAKNQRMTVHGANQPIWLVADEEKLHMAVSNLVDNASKYTSEAGRIEVSLYASARTVGIEVADTGMGIDKQEQSDIFDRFQRAHGILMSGVEGTGLGLYLVRRIAELHNGKIEVKSRKGHGSTFTLTLPREDRHHAT